MTSTMVQELIDSIKGGEKIRTCIQCGTCSGSCPLTDRMDHAPRELFALVRDGETEAVLASNTPWYCVSCYQCMARCPREIPITDIMYSLKQIAAREGTAPKNHKMPDLYNAFNREIAENGKVTDAMVMMRYGMRHPVDMLRQTPLAFLLLKKGRLEFTPRRIRFPKRLTRTLQRPPAGEETR